MVIQLLWRNENWKCTHIVNFDGINSVMTHSLSQSIPVHWGWDTVSFTNSGIHAGLNLLIEVETRSPSDIAKKLFVCCMQKWSIDQSKRNYIIGKPSTIKNWLCCWLDFYPSLLRLMMEGFISHHITVLQFILSPPINWQIYLMNCCI